MNKKILHFVVIGLLNSSLGYQSVLALPPTLNIEMSAETNIPLTGDSFDVIIKNNQDADFTCDSVDVSATLVRAEFDQVLGIRNYSFSNVYVNAGKNESLFGIASKDIEALKKAGTPARVITASAKLNHCKKATFNDYCSYANHNNSENNTLNALKSLFRTDSCELVSANISNSLSLRNFEITDLTAISFLTDLVNLDLSNNLISDVSKLSSLRALRSVDISNNPLQNIDAVINLPYMQKIDADSTDLQNSKYLGTSSLSTGPYLRKVCIGHTPLISSLDSIPSPFSKHCW